MGKGSIGNKSGYKTRKGYYISSDYDEKFGGKFSLFLEPLNGNDGELFFYVMKQENGKFEVTGEGYIVASRRSLLRHISDMKKELPGKTIWYYHIDKDGNVIRKEKGYEL